MEEGLIKRLVTILFLVFLTDGVMANAMVSLGGDRYNDSQIIEEVEYYARELGIGANVSIRVNFTLDLPRGTQGTIDYIDMGEFAQVMIWIDRRAGRSSQLNTIAHEMVHASQLLKGEMKIVSNNEVLWMGESYDLSRVNYLDRPWEEDAIKRGEVLRRQYLNQGNVGLIF